MAVSKTLVELLDELDVIKTNIEDNHIALGMTPNVLMYTQLSNIIKEIETHIATLKNNNARKMQAQVELEAAKKTLAAKPSAGGRRRSKRRSKKTRRHSKPRAKKTRRN
jgi:predicted glycosyl hydrolase (DUF1957 family)